VAKKRKKRPRPPGQAGPATAGAATDTAAPPRGETRPQPRPQPTRRHKEEARRAKELALKRLRRRTLLRRLGTFAVMAAVIGGVTTFFLVRNAATTRTVTAANRAAEAAGCTAPGDIERPLDPAYLAGNNVANHLGPGETATYNTVPATSGRHTSSTLPADRHVYTEAVPEQTAVHNLEHGYVLIYYRADGDGALAKGVVDRLASFARGEGKVILAPYESLEVGTALAFVAWQDLRTCPAGVTPAQAADMAEGFVADYRSGGGNAPEPNGV